MSVGIQCAGFAQSSQSIIATVAALCSFAKHRSQSAPSALDSQDRMRSAQRSKSPEMIYCSIYYILYA